MSSIDDLKNEKGEIETENIKKIIPYVEPFLFVDKVIKLEKKKIVAIRKVRKDEFYLKGHFANFPIMPGALIAEGIGQAGTLLIRYNLENHETKDVLAYNIKKAQFKYPTFPGQEMRYEVELKNGLKHGNFEEYYSNGKIKIKGKYKKDKQTGVWKYYSSDGILVKKKKFDY